jgi:hypothetical protein
MKLKYIGKEPFRFAVPGRITELKKGDTIEVPDERGVKWLNAERIKKLFEEVKDKKGGKE